MASSPPYTTALTQIIPNEELYPPYSPIMTSLKFKGIPFSWEKNPGIPKHQELNKKKKKEYSEHLLPLPPAGNSNSTTAKKLHHHSSNRSSKRDPFFAALVECSKEDGDNKYDHHGTNVCDISSKITRSVSDRFGFINMYASCKRTCAVSESIVCLPRSSTPHYLDYRRSN